MCKYLLFNNQLIIFFFHRLTPAYMVVLLMAEVSSRWLRNSSVFEPENNNHISCAKYWWRNMLYINSLYPQREMVIIVFHSAQKYDFNKRSDNNTKFSTAVHVMELVYVQRHAVLRFSGVTTSLLRQVNNIQY